MCFNWTRNKLQADMMPFVDKLIFSWDISLTMIENPPLKRLEKTVHKNKMIASMKRKPKIYNKQE